MGAEKNSLVKGTVEDGGEWLRTSGHGYLPMKMNGTQILIYVSEDVPRSVNEKRASHSWCLCLPSNQPSDSWPPDEFPVDSTSSKKDTSTLFAPEVRRAD